MTFEEIKQLNEKKLEEYKKSAISEKEILIHEKIKKLLDENPAIFFQIPMEDALKILSKLVSEEDLEETYTSLIGPDKYKELRDKFKV